MRPTPPPQEMFDRMCPSVQGVLEIMVKEGQLSKEEQADGSYLYKIEAQAHH